MNLHKGIELKGIPKEQLIGNDINEVFECINRLNYSGFFLQNGDWVLGQDSQSV